MIILKKLVSGILVLIIILMLSACDKKNDNSSTVTSENSAESESSMMAEESGANSEGDASATTSLTEQTGEKAKLGRFEIEVTEVKRVKDKDKKDCIIVTYRYENISDKKISITMAAMREVYQGNKKLERAEIDGIQNKNKTIVKKGKPVSAQIAYVLNDNKTDITIRIRGMDKESRSTVYVKEVGISDVKY